MIQLRSSGGTRTRTPARWGRRVALTVALSLVAGGCYTYQPVDGPVPVGTETVRIQLTGAGQDDLRERQGIQLERFEGRVLEASGDELTVQVRLPANRLAFSEQDFVDTLQFIRPHLRTVDVKQFSTGRTILGVGGAIAGSALAYVIVDAAVNSGEGGGEGGGNVELSVVPWITTVLGWLR